MIIDKMSSELGVTGQSLSVIIRSADKRYRTYPIPKRTGGDRIISQPSKKLKFVQRWLVKRVLRKLPVHGVATAYIKNKNIVANAAPHTESRYILKLDFSDFFPSITYGDIVTLLEANADAVSGVASGIEDFEIIAKAITYNGALTIGAPSSPAISNAIMYQFDQSVNQYCKDHALTYTRYADDITISSRIFDMLPKAHVHVRSLLESSASPRLSINDAKTKFVSKKYRRLVTGLIITSDGRVSIGRDRKRFLKSMVFKFINDDIDVDELESLKGWISYVHSVEPSFLKSLSEKYSAETIELLLRVT